MLVERPWILNRIATASSKLFFLVGKGLVILADSCSCFVATSIFIYNIILTLSLPRYLPTAPGMPIERRCVLFWRQRRIFYCSPTNFFRHSKAEWKIRPGRNCWKHTRAKSEKERRLRLAIELSAFYFCELISHRIPKTTDARTGGPNSVRSS